MNLADIPAREPLRPFMHGGKIPWHDPAFSARMLREHLTQEHEAASRRVDRIDRHVAWLHRELLRGKQGRVLDLGCGPGLYTSRLARHGHTCVGLDIGPASIEHARAEAARDGLACEYRLSDVRDGDYGEGYDLAMLVFGELNTFDRLEVERILHAAAASLAPRGVLVLEVETPDSIKTRGRSPAPWSSADQGLFGDRPYLCLQERAWFEEERATVERFLVVDTATSGIRSYAVTTLAWDDPELDAALERTGFEAPRRYRSLEGVESAGQESLFVLTARRRSL